MGKVAHLPSASKLRSTAALISLATIAVGLSGLAGWAVGISVLTSFLPGSVRITVNTSICMVLMGLSLWLLRDPDARRIVTRLAQVMAVAVSGVGVLSLLEFINGWDLHIDQLFIVPTAQQATGWVRPGLMSPIAATCFALLGLGLALLDWTTRKGLWPTQVLAMTAEIASSFALLDYLLSPQGHHTGIALQTAIVLFAFPFALICMRPTRGLGKLLLDTAPLWLSHSRGFGNHLQTRVLRFGLAAAATGIATLLRLWLGSFGVSSPFLTYFPAVMIVCLFAGVGPGLLSVLLSAICVDYLFLPPFYTFGMDSVSASISLELFLVTGIGYCLLLGSTNLYRQRSQADARRAAIEKEKARHDWKATFDALSESVVLLDSDQRVLQANRATTELLRLEFGQIIGKRCSEVMHQRLSLPLESPVLSVLATGREKRTEFHEPLLDRTLEVVAAPLPDPAGGNTRCIHIVRDITERKQAEKKLGEQAALLELAHDAIIVRSTDARIAFWNRGASELYGWSAEEAVGQISHELLQTAFPEPLPVIEANVSRHGEWEGELTHVCRNGKRVIVASRWSLQRDERENPIGCLEINRDITDRKRAEAALQESEEMMRLAMAAGGMGAWNLDLVNDTAWRSIEHDRIFGYEELLPEWETEIFLSHVLPEDREYVQKRFEEAFRTGHLVFECRIRRADKTVRWISAEGEISYNDQHKPARMAGFVSDITERKEAQRSLELSEARHRSLITATAQIVWTTAPSGEVDDMPLWREYTGMTVEQIRGWGWLDSLHPDDRPLTAAAWAAAVRDRTFYETEYRIRRKDGEYRTVVARAVPVLETDGNVREWIGTCTDITERKRAAAELRESEERYRSVIAAMAEGVVLQDADGKIIASNASGERILGIVGGRLQSQTSVDLQAITIHEDGTPFPGETHPAMVALHTGHRQSGICMGIRKADSSVTWILINAEPMYQGEETHPHAVVTTFTDITDRKRAEQKVLWPAISWISLIDAPAIANQEQNVCRLECQT